MEVAHIKLSNFVVTELEWNFSWGWKNVIYELNEQLKSKGFSS